LSTLSPPPTSALFPYPTLFRSESLLPCTLELERFGDPAPALRSHDGLPVHRRTIIERWQPDLPRLGPSSSSRAPPRRRFRSSARSEEHTSELQSLTTLLCRLLL